MVIMCGKLPFIVQAYPINRKQCVSQGKCTKSLFNLHKLKNLNP